MTEPTKHKLIAHPWPPHYKTAFWHCFGPDDPIDWVIKIYKEREGTLPEYVVLTPDRWQRESGSAEPDSAYYLYEGVKITWHPESLGLMRVGPKGKR